MRNNDEIKKNTVTNGDSISLIKRLPEQCAHLILSDIPYGIGMEEWDVLHNNSNNAYLGSSPAQKKAGAVFKKRGKPINGWYKGVYHVEMVVGYVCEGFDYNGKPILALKWATRLDVNDYVDEDDDDDDEIENDSSYGYFNLDELYGLLDIAILEEDYEKAARIRDEINNRESL